MNLHTIDKWFENYDKWIHQAERAERLGIAWEQEDKLLNVTYHSVDDLDVCAEEMRKQYKLEKEQYLQNLRKKS
jgi:hypothetical protein